MLKIQGPNHVRLSLIPLAGIYYQPMYWTYKYLNYHTKHWECVILADAVKILVGDIKDV